MKKIAGEESKGALGRFLNRCFPDREILSRSNGQIKCIRISRGKQITAALSAAVIAGWVGFTSYTYFMFDHVKDLRQDELVQTRLKYQNLLNEFDEARKNEAATRQRMRELKENLVNLNAANTDAVERLSTQATEHAKTIERGLTLTGLEVKTLLKRAGYKLDIGQGGPFVPADDGTPEETIKANISVLDTHTARLDGLTAILRMVPIGEPMDYYYITSRFGKRKDPINGRWGTHYGLDMGSLFKRSEILAPADGTVTHAGRKGKYGKFIEIDHGLGIKTRYGHLHEIEVEKGDKVKYRQPIGKMGSTGRSNGDHLHYEIRVDGRSVDPLKFIKAGKYVFKG